MVGTSNQSDPGIPIDMMKAELMLPKGAYFWLSLRGIRESPN